MRQSAMNVTQRRSFLGVTENKNDMTNPDYASPTRSLFKTNKESLEDMLVRKLKQKYIESNTAFASILPYDETASLLSNNYMNHLSKKHLGGGRNRTAAISNENSSGANRYRTKTSQLQTLPKIRISNLGLEQNSNSQLNNAHGTDELATSLSPKRKVFVK